MPVALDRGPRTMKIVLLAEGPALERTLAQASFTIDRAADEEELAGLLSTFSYDAAVLVRTARPLRAAVGRLRDRDRLLPILAVGVDDAEERIACLHEGADDAVGRAAGAGEIAARVIALARRARGHGRAALRVGDVTVDLAAKSAFVGARPIDLTAKEFKLLRFFALHDGAVLDKQQVLDALYTSEDEPDDRIVGVYLCTLRRKLREAGARITISTRRGLGYVLQGSFAGEEEPLQVAAERGARRHRASAPRLELASAGR